MGPSKAGAGCGSGEARTVSDTKFLKSRVVVAMVQKLKKFYMLMLAFMWSLLLFTYIKN